jgi:hypothetical protein
LRGAISVFGVMRTAIDAKRLVVELNAPELIVLVRTVAQWLFVRSPHRISRTSALSAAILSPTFSCNLGVAVAPGGDDRGRQFALPPIVNRVIAHLFGILNRRPNYTSNFSLYPIQH